MPKIFISYRRADSQDVTDRIHDHLLAYFGDGSIFQDVDSIPFGVDFRQHLSNEVNQCDVVLVIIGPDWARMIQERMRQLNDFVRVEVESALKLKKWVIPVLVRGAEMPAPDELPESIRDLCWLNAARVRPNPDFRRDCQVLAEGIQKGLANNVQIPSTSQTVSPPPRPLNSVYDLLPPPFEWIEIPAGKVTLVNDWDDDKKVYLKKNKPQTFDVPAFAIAKYPVTNAQFAEFMKAGGYTERRWWTDVGWQMRLEKNWTEPRRWQAPKWNGAEQPVVGVSWYEAMAFCQWLLEASGEAVMLPTEQQWQRAAQGDDGHTYPWGNEWDCTRCNNSLSPCDSSGTTPVRQYEGVGDSPFGVVDMVGNVWEWCLTEYYSGSASPDGTDVRVLHGGSWNVYTSGDLRATLRGWSNPVNGYYYGGFRCARSS